MDQQIERLAERCQGMVKLVFKEKPWNILSELETYCRIFSNESEPVSDEVEYLDMLNMKEGFYTYMANAPTGLNLPKLRDIYRKTSGQSVEFMVDPLTILINIETNLIDLLDFQENNISNERLSRYQKELEKIRRRELKQKLDREREEQQRERNKDWLYFVWLRVIWVIRNLTKIFINTDLYLVILIKTYLIFKDNK